MRRGFDCNAALEGELLVDHPYLCKLLEIANNKFRVNAERIARFENLLKAFLERTRDDEPPVMQPSSQSDSPCSESQPHGLPGVKCDLVFLLPFNGLRLEPLELTCESIYGELQTVGSEMLLHTCTALCWWL